MQAFLTKKQNQAMVARNSKEEEMANKEAEKKKKRKRERERVCIVCHTYILLSS